MTIWRRRGKRGGERKRKELVTDVKERKEGWRKCCKRKELETEKKRTKGGKVGRKDLREGSKGRREGEREEGREQENKE